MNTTYHQELGLPRPKRGDILQTNIGTSRERTFLILGSKSLQPKWTEQMGMIAQRTKLWAERWWEIEPQMRMALFRSAERNGGQNLHTFFRFKSKQKPKPFIGW